MYRHVNQDSNLPFSNLLYMNRSEATFKAKTIKLVKNLGTKQHILGPISRLCTYCVTIMTNAVMNIMKTLILNYDNN